MKLILPKNTKLSSAGGSAPRPSQQLPPIADLWLHAYMKDWQKEGQMKLHHLSTTT